MTSIDNLVLLGNSTEDNHNYFFGYHNLQSFSPCSRFHLAHKTHLSTGMPPRKVPIQLGIFEISNPELFLPLTTEICWNWQQGTLAQFVDENIILNTYSENNSCLQSKIISPSGQEIQRYSAPYYCIDYCGSAFGVNFRRISRYHLGYDYNSTGHDFDSVRSDLDDYIYKINLVTGSIAKLISIHEIAYHSKHMFKGKRYAQVIENLACPTSGSYVSFIYRFRDGSGNYYNWLGILNTCDISLSFYQGGDRCSHYAWFGDSAIIIYSGNSQSFFNRQKQSFGPAFALKTIRKIRKYLPIKFQTTPNILTGDGYFLLNLSDALKNDRLIFLPETDGHPACCGTENLIVTDTYQDYKGKRYIYIYNQDILRKKIEIDSSSESDNTGWRCDLHPRISCTSGLLSFDLFYKNKRRIAVTKCR